MTDSPSRVAFVESSYTGAGQDCIEAVLERGLLPVLLSRNPSVYPYLDDGRTEVVVCDTESADRVRESLLRLHRLVAVGTTDEYSVAVTARVARELGLPGPEPRAALACRDKRIMRETVNAELSPAWTTVESIGSIHRAGLGYPLIVKPANLTGSALVRLCHSDSDVEAHLFSIRSQEATESTPLPTVVLAEEFVDGPEFSVEFMDGALLGVTRKHLFPGAGFVEAGHDFPLPDSHEAHKSVAAAAVSALGQLGALWGPIHMELRWTPTAAKVIEVNGRLPGDRIPRLVELATGFSLSRAYVGRLLGDPALVAPPAARRGAAIRMWRADRAATLIRASGLADAKAAPSVVAAEFFGVEGRSYVPQRSNLDRIGYLTAVGDDAEDAGSHAEAASAMLRLSWRPSV